MKNADKLPLTSAEIGNLWITYMGDAVSGCVKKYFVAKAEDNEIRAVVQQAQTISEKRMADIAAILTSCNQPVPVGFGEKDVNLAAPRLYSDTFALYHALSRTRWASVVMSNGLFLAARPDVRKVFYDGVGDSIKLNEHATNVALSKGLYIRSPIVDTPPEPHFVEKPSYIGSIIGEHRPLHVISVGSIFLSLIENIVGKALVIGFSQTAHDQEVRKFFLRGADIGAKHIKVLSNLLNDESIPIPSSPDSLVTGSTIPAFSDKMMMGHILTINSVGIADIGLAIGQSTRADIAADYLRLMAEVIQYGEDGINISIKNGWMEAPPQVVSHRELALSGKS